MRNLLTLLAFLIPIGHAMAEETMCPVVQVCPLKNCPYIDSNNNEYKQQVYTEGCAAFAREEGGIFVNYVSGPSPQCKIVIKVGGKIDCNLLK